MVTTRQRLLGACGAASVLIAAGAGAPALAQSADAGAREAEVVVVTAQRRDQDIQSVPVSVTAISSEALAERNIVDIGKLSVITPGFTYGRSGIDSRPAMRGVRTENVGVNGDTTIGYFIDGIYQSRAAQASAAFVDVSRVEVQRGPQGTLYGRNTFGGNISVITNQPDPSGFDFGFNAELGSFESVKADGFVNVPIGELGAFRISAAAHKSDGFVENVFNAGADLFDNDMRYVRAALLLEPTENLSITLRADTLNQSGNGGSAFGYKLIGSYYDLALGAPVFNSTPFILNTRPNNRDGVDDNPNIAGIQDLGVPIFAPKDPFRIDQDLQTFLDLNRDGLGADISWDVGPVTLRSITGKVDFKTARSSDTDFSRNTLGIDYQLTASESLSQEFQVLSRHEGPFQYVLGVYYFEDDLRGVFINQQLPPVINGVLVNGGVPFGGSFYDDQIARTESIAYYGQFDFSVTDKLTLTAGIRQTEDDKSFRVNRPATQSAANAVGVIIANPVPFDFDPGPGVQLQLNRTFEKTTWRLGAQYDLTDTNFLYGSVATGFRSGGFNTQTAAAAQFFAPEEVTAYEIGSKNQFFDRALTLNVAAFFNKYEDLQEQRQVPVGATTASIIFNAAEAEAFGLEVEAVWAPTDVWSIGGTLSLLNAEYTNFTGAPIPGGFSNPITGPGVFNAALAPRGLRCGVVPGSVTAGTPNGVLGCDLSGNKIPYSPEYSGTVYGSYSFDLGRFGTLTPFASVSFAGESYGQAFNTQLEKTDAYARLDASVEWAPSDRLSVRVFVDNATDEVILNRAVYGGGGVVQGSWQPPRTWGARISVRN